jgi:hypothetical protein
MVMLYSDSSVEQYFVVPLLMLIVLIQVYQHQLLIVVYMAVVQVGRNIRDEQEH